MASILIMLQPQPAFSSWLFLHQVPYSSLSFNSSRVFCLGPHWAVIQLDTLSLSQISYLSSRAIFSVFPGPPIFFAFRALNDVFLGRNNFFHFFN
jgi:hypothetical protein